MDELQRKSPIAKIADYFVAHMKAEPLPFKSSYEAKMENSVAKLKFDGKAAAKQLFSIQKYDEPETDASSICSLLLTRRALVDQLALAEQLVKREQIKRQIIDRFNN